MLLQCPRCRAVQDDADRTCLKCGEPLTPPPGALPSRLRRLGRSRSDVFHFAEPVPVAEVEQTAILPIPHPPTRPTPSPSPRRPRSRYWKPAVAAGLGLALAGGTALLLRSERHSHPAPARPVTQPARAAGIAAPSDEITLVTSRPSGHVPVGSAVLVTATTPPAQDPSARVSLYSRHGSGPKVLFSSAQGSSCRARWTPHTAGHYVLTATAESSQGQIPVAISLKMIVDPAKTGAAAHRRVPLSVRVAQFPRRHDAAALANRLGRRGIPAMVRAIRDRNGVPAYQVETGAHRARRGAQGGG